MTIYEAKLVEKDRVRNASDARFDKHANAIREAIGYDLLAEAYERGKMVWDRHECGNAKLTIKLPGHRAIEAEAMPMGMTDNVRFRVLDFVWPFKRTSWPILFNTFAEALVAAEK